MTKDDAVPVTAEEAAAIPGDIWAQVDAIAGPFGDTPRQYARCIDRLRCALARQLLLARHRGSTAGVDVDLVAQAICDEGKDADAPSAWANTDDFSKAVWRKYARSALASLSQTPATPMVQEGLREALADPNAVHVNMLRGGIAKPSIAQIIHIYGEDAIRAALADRTQEGEVRRG